MGWLKFIGLIVNNEGLQFLAIIDCGFIGYCAGQK
jgi:hypothetical protein